MSTDSITRRVARRDETGHGHDMTRLAGAWPVPTTVIRRHSSVLKLSPGSQVAALYCEGVSLHHRDRGATPWNDDPAAQFYWQERPHQAHDEWWSGPLHAIVIVLLLVAC